MNVSDGFFLGLAFAAAFGTVVLSLVRKVAARAHERRERRRMDQEVRLAFVRLASTMRRADSLTRAKQDMPWEDRLREAQVATVVNLGVSVRKVAAT